MLLVVLRILRWTWWFAKALVLSALIASVVAVGMIVANYFGKHQYGGDDFQMNLVTEMIGVWASTCVTVLVVDRLFASREREKEKERLRREIAVGDNAIAKRAILTLRVNYWLVGDAGILRNSYLFGSDLHDADLRGANLKSAILHSANLQNASLTNADLRQAQLGNADLRKCKLFGAYLVGAEFNSGDSIDSSILTRLARLSTGILGDSVQQLLNAKGELAAQLDTIKELEREYEVQISEWESMKEEAEELQRQIEAGNGLSGELAADNEAQILRLKQQISEMKETLAGLRDSKVRNEDDQKRAANLIVYGTEETAAHFENTVLPDGTLFTEGMALTELKRFTDSDDERFDKTLKDVNRIRKDMGYPVLIKSKCG